MGERTTEKRGREGNIKGKRRGMLGKYVENRAKEDGREKRVREAEAFDREI